MVDTEALNAPPVPPVCAHGCTAAATTVDYAKAAKASVFVMLAGCLCIWMVHMGFAADSCRGYRQMLDNVTIEAILTIAELRHNLTMLAADNAALRRQIGNYTQRLAECTAWKEVDAVDNDDPPVPPPQQRDIIETFFHLVGNFYIRLWRDMMRAVYSLLMHVLLPTIERSIVLCESLVNY